MKLRPTLITILALTCHAALAGDTALGRLFTTPAERAELDQARLHGGALPLQAAEPDNPSATLYGYVVKNDGTSTAWLNPALEEQVGKHLMITQSPRHAPVVSIKTESGRRIVVKVGDTLDLKTGQLQPLLSPAEATPVTTERRPALTSH